MNKKLVFSLLLVCLLTFVAVMAFGQNSPNVRWEYTAIGIGTSVDNENGRKVFVENANRLGQEGWELVQVIGYTSVYKRRLP